MEKNKNILNLEKISKKDRSDIVKEVSDTLLLLQANQSSPEIEMLKQIGLDGHIRKAETVKQNIQRFTAFEHKYNRSVYAGNQVKEYCEEHGYRIIRVDKFKHEVPLEVGKAIIQFNEENTFEHQQNEERKIKKSNINLQTSNFFLLISIQAINGAPVKSATLFYREEYHHDNYERIDERDMLVEVHSWGVPGDDKSLLWYYIQATEYLVIFPIVFMIIGIICIALGENSHGLLLFLMICSLIAVITSKKPSFFKWN